MTQSDIEGTAAVDPGAICDRCLQWAAEHEFAGWDPYDGLNSPYLSAVAMNWLTRLVGIHLVAKAPVNLRPLLDVPKERNPKGIALFAMASLNRYRATGEAAHCERAERLLRWLTDNQASDYDAASWGYNFDWQNGRKFFVPAYSPSIVVTIFCGRAFLDYYTITDEQWALSTAQSAARFIRTAINRQRVNGFDVFSYTPHDEFVLVNTNAMAADFFYQLSEHTGSPELAARASHLFEFVIDTQTPSGGWYYSVPSDESHLSHDNFHTGFVVESLYAYAMDQPADHPARTAYENGLAFYRRELFEDDGAPRFEAETRYPYDAHAAAQALLTFAQCGDMAMTEKLLRWSMANLWDSDGYFYRRIGRHRTDTTPYMRWSQSWMSYGLSVASRCSAQLTAAR